MPPFVGHYKEVPKKIIKGSQRCLKYKHLKMFVNNSTGNNWLITGFYGKHCSNYYLDPFENGPFFVISAREK